MSPSGRGLLELGRGNIILVIVESASLAGRVHIRLGGCGVSDACGGKKEILGR